MAEGDLDDPTYYGSIVRDNLMKRPGYAPYCMCCTSLNRMIWDGEQFKCHFTKQRTEFPADFIAGYKARWHQSIKSLCLHPAGTPAGTTLWRGHR